MVDVFVRAGVIIGVGVGIGAGIDFGGQSVGDTSCSRCFDFLSEECKKQEEDSIMYLQTLSQAVNEFKKIRGGQGHSIKECPGSIYSTGQEEKISFIKTIQNLKKKIFRELPMVVGEKLLEIKQVNLYKHVPIAQKNKLLELMRVKNLCVQYDMHYFSGNNFRTMTSMNIWWKHWYIDEILSLMWESHLRYPEYYDSTDRIIDLNFYTNFKQRCDNISEEATRVGGRSFTRLINEFVWNDDMIDYVRLYLGGMDWIGAKRILVVINMNNAHFVTLKILLHEGCMNICDCNLIGMKHAKFFIFIQPVFELLPNLLKQSEIIKHLPDKFLNEP
ncbi:hypothetical protein KY290_024743 [Solanum tuberosum]|uniref:Uncharacterized protein n=1 Tax=Solanum tuberosum TaxID=4113 RepID=A0ABQ7URM7_SOLTU|nr:hypothetical protein KY284_023598 [Solanum tuberosum]KAH0754473.1 hypothetical protein KY290_024743 [Solanum tuberosum]